MEKKLLLKWRLIFLAVFFFKMTAAMAHEEPIWSQTYYGGISTSTGLPTPYCNASTPGTFIGISSQQLENGAITDKGIRLSHFIFNQREKNDEFVMTGSVLEKLPCNKEEAEFRSWGCNDNNFIEDKIYYALHKATENGLTHGRWTNSQCSGHFVGYVLSAVTD